ncbi:hypothetical protein [Kitasatospora aureofaciens]|uniref:hypothetical protein n=1 Tax=Kitasatospora aureofaciens TaxID=1894 RepID=UPI001C4575C8|nr:hypothetical protein [Kitasatospora aureofaciens]MBV6698706.1 hypothetical protein [Kitasatospora aureofaciens]
MPDTPEASIESGPSERRVAWYRRRRMVFAVVLTVVVGAGSGLWWWASRDPLKLPASACWSLLDQNDLRSLAGAAQGTYTVRHGEHDGDEIALLPGIRSQTCTVAQDYRVLSGVTVRLWDKLTYHDVYEANADPAARRQSDLGPDIQGLWEEDSRMRLAFLCDNPAAELTHLTYLEVVVWGDSELVDPKLPSVRQARLDAALKVAKAAATTNACVNPVHFPARAKEPGVV